MVPRPLFCGTPWDPGGGARLPSAGRWPWPGCWVWRGDFGRDRLSSLRVRDSRPPPAGFLVPVHCRVICHRHWGPRSLSLSVVTRPPGRTPSSGLDIPRAAPALALRPCGRAGATGGVGGPPCGWAAAALILCGPEAGGGQKGGCRRTEWRESGGTVAPET